MTYWAKGADRSQQFTAAQRFWSGWDLMWRSCHWARMCGYAEAVLAAAWREGLTHWLPFLSHCLCDNKIRGYHHTNDTQLKFRLLVIGRLLDNYWYLLITVVNPHVKMTWCDSSVKIIWCSFTCLKRMCVCSFSIYWRDTFPWISKLDILLHSHCYALFDGSVKDWTTRLNLQMF